MTTAAGRAARSAAGAASITVAVIRADSAPLRLAFAVLVPDLLVLGTDGHPDAKELAGHRLIEGRLPTIHCVCITLFLVSFLAQAARPAPASLCFVLARSLAGTSSTWLDLVVALLVFGIASLDGRYLTILADHDAPFGSGLGVGSPVMNDVVDNQHCPVC